MPAIVDSVINNSIAQELGIQKGDELVSVDGQIMSDMIDYNFYMKSEDVTILIRHPNGEEEEIEIEKDYDEDIQENTDADNSAGTADSSSSFLHV